ncbi:polyol transporter 2-like protein 1 [Seiridium cupressi]
MGVKFVPNYVFASGDANERVRGDSGDLTPFLVGFTVSLIMLTGAVPSISAGQLADSLGRHKVITLGAVLFGIGAAIEGSSYGLPQFLVGRALAGFGEGVYLSNVAVYICEIAPVKHRGILAGLPQFMSTAGICIGLSPWQSLALLFRRGYRSRTILALFILGMVQLSGIDGVLYYAPILFSQAGLSSHTASFLASGLSAILMLVISIPAFLLADKWGRRTSAITGGIGLAILMLLIGTLYAAGVVHPYGVARWVVIVAVFAFGLTYCATWGIVGKIYASEIQPSNTRAAANCVAQGLGFFTNWLVAILTPILLDKSAFGAYFLFGGLALGTVAVLAAYMPETRGRSLEEIQEAFHQPGLKSVTQYVRRRVRRDSNIAGDPIELRASENVVQSIPTSSRSSLPGLRLDISTA